MKLNATKFFAFAAIVGLVFTACKKSNHDSGPVSATVNGSGFNAKAAVAIHYSTNKLFEVTAFQVSKNDSSIVDLEFTDQFTIGKASSSDTAAYMDLEYFPTTAGWNNLGGGNYYDSYYSSGATIVTITSWDQSKKTIAGTFTGSATSVQGGSGSSDSVTIKSGKFNVTYTEQ